MSAIEIQTHIINNGQPILLREARVEDAGAVLAYNEAISNESDFLSFGTDEFELDRAQEEHILRSFRLVDNQLYILGLVEEEIISALSFIAGHRPRTRHSELFGMSVRKKHLGLGIGSLMVDTLLKWAAASQIIRKINLRVRPDNDRAIALYQRKGFQIEGTISREMLLDGKFFDHYFMGLEI